MMDDIEDEEILEGMGIIEKADQGLPKNCR